MTTNWSGGSKFKVMGIHLKAKEMTLELNTSWNLAPARLKTVVEATWQASNHHPTLGLRAPRWSWNSQDQKEYPVIYTIVSWQKNGQIYQGSNWPKCWSTKIYLFFLLINKNVIQNFIDQQNLQNGEPPKCWSTKFPPQILLINKISTSHFVDQQNVQFHYQLLQGGTAPPAGALPKFLGDLFEP